MDILTPVWISLVPGNELISGANKLLSGGNELVSGGND